MNFLFGTRFIAIYFRSFFNWHKNHSPPVWYHTIIFIDRMLNVFIYWIERSNMFINGSEKKSQWVQYAHRRTKKNKLTIWISIFGLSNFSFTDCTLFLASGNLSAALIQCPQIDKHLFDLIPQLVFFQNQLSSQGYMCAEFYISFE